MSAASLHRTVVRVSDTVETVLRIAGGAAFTAFIVTVIIQVIGRNLMRTWAAIWTVELATLLFVWSIFLGAAIAVRHGRHYVLDVVPKGWSRARGVTHWFGLMAIALAAYVFLHFGWAFLELAERRISTQLRITQYWFYLAIPVGGGAMLFFVAEHVLCALLARAEPDRAAATGDNPASAANERS